jgi:hypothetical protein
MRILGQDIAESFKFILNNSMDTLERFYAKLSKLDMKKGSKMTKNSS